VALLAALFLSLFFSLPPVSSWLFFLSSVFYLLPYLSKLGGCFWRLGNRSFGHGLCAIGQAGEQVGKRANVHLPTPNTFLELCCRVLVCVLEAARRLVVSLRPLHESRTREFRDVMKLKM
jgi:hypothetical protein